MTLYLMLFHYIWYYQGGQTGCVWRDRRGRRPQWSQRRGGRGGNGRGDTVTSRAGRDSTDDSCHWLTVARYIGIRGLDLWSWMNDLREQQPLFSSSLLKPWCPHIYTQCKHDRKRGKGGRERWRWSWGEGDGQTDRKEERKKVEEEEEREGERGVPEHSIFEPK